MRFFKNAQFDFDTRICLGYTYHRAADVGEVLATIDRIKDGDHEGWYREWFMLAQRMEAVARKSEAAGHHVSARDAWLRAATYYDVANGSLDGTTDPSRLVPTWRKHRAAFARFGALWDPPFEAVEIPCEGKRMAGTLFRPKNASGRLPVLILNNGSDGPITSVWVAAGQAALERGWMALTFDGPGQGHSLWEDGIPFRPDWEKVITPVVDWLEARPDVDRDRIALYGISQAGYWVPRAAAFEHRLAAIVADGGVWDVASSWMAQLPAKLQKMLREGKREEFEKAMALGLRFASETMKQTIAFRMKPYGKASLYDVYQAVQEYRLDTAAAKQIRCPSLILDAEGDQFWPGQPEQLYRMLDCPRTLMRFTAAEGAGMHCEPMAVGLREQRVMDWLEETVSSEQ